MAVAVVASGVSGPRVATGSGAVVVASAAGEIPQANAAAALRPGGDAVATAGGRSARRAPVVRTVTFSGRMEIAMVPSVSVRSTRAPWAARRSIVAGAG
jgi:hypothetical protein